MVAAGDERASARSVVPTVLRVAGGAIVGAAGAAGGFALADAHSFDLLDGRWSFTLALWLGATFLLIGLSFLVASFAGRHAITVFPALDGLSAQGMGRATFIRLQGAVLTLAGACLLIPPVYAASPAPGTGAAHALFALIVALIALQSWLNLRVWRGSDELLRRVTIETGAASFWLLQGALFLWAAAEVLGLAPAMTSWDHLSILMLVYVAVSTIISTRLGFHKGSQD